MPRGVPDLIPDDGLTTRQRRNQPVLAVHTGDGKGKSTAAFGMAMRVERRPAGRGVPVREECQVEGRGGVGPARPRQGALRRGAGGPVEWHKMGQGWSWLRANTDHADDHAGRAGGPR